MQKNLLSCIELLCQHLRCLWLIADGINNRAIICSSSYGTHTMVKQGDGWLASQPSDGILEAARHNGGAFGADMGRLRQI